MKTLLAAVLSLVTAQAGAQGADALNAAFIQASALPRPSRAARAATNWQVLSAADLAGGAHHQRHAELFGKYAVGFNARILAGADKVQGTAMSGGGYFTGVTATPPESPIGYALALFGNALLVPPRKTSYCTGASYAAFIEALNMILSAPPAGFDAAHAEAMRMQEPDGSRRPDGEKFWGRWNADFFGLDYALIQYSGMGQEIAPEDARAGDLMNIGWTNGESHSVVFLGWYLNKGVKSVVFWSSNESTNGLGDEIQPVSKIKGVRVVRLTSLAGLSTFDITGKPTQAPSWVPVTW
jgi:hypothetical protein